jgi:cytochrome c peroxidase
MNLAHRYKKIGFLIFWLLATVLPRFAWSHGTAAEPLGGVKIPATPGLLEGSNRIVVDQRAAIQLGKSLFWDTNVGSDGQACATCHFHAGADRRVRNQLNTGDSHTTAITAKTFEMTGSGQQGGPNYSLTANDFPFYRFSVPGDRSSAVIYQTDDVVGSAGSFKRDFLTATAFGEVNDQCSDSTDDIYHLGLVNTRRVTNRNAPTVINSGFNYRNFWDGRANNLFNGESAFGARDPQAGIWVLKNGKPKKQRILLKNASLASQAVAPPLHDVEMSCAQRKFPDLARKLLDRRALENQEVHPEDGVLGVVSDASGKGLNKTYKELIGKAFHQQLWARKGQFGKAPDGSAYSQIEANMPLFFGIAIKLYEDTLISEQALFDTERNEEDNVPIAFNDQQKRGLDLFMNAHCANCHTGPTFSSAAHPQVYGSPSNYLDLVNRSGFNEESSGVGVALSLMDAGYLITSVAPLEFDVGLGGKDPWGNPLSFAQQYLDTLADPKNKMIDPVKVVACEMQSPFTLDFNTSEVIKDKSAKGYCMSYKDLAKVPSPSVVKAELEKPMQGRVSRITEGAFKIPSLRNVELTGPYMHNGSMKSLEEVIDFYSRGGNNVGYAFHAETLVFPQGFSNQDKADLLAFLKTLTDERVRWERAPFDHPALDVPDGHDEGQSVLGPLYAADHMLHLPAIGKNGRSLSQGPLLPFENYLNTSRSEGKVSNFIGVP